MKNKVITIFTSMLLIAAFVGCKVKNEPENRSADNPEKQEPTIGFMQHIENLEGATFYRPLDYNCRFRFETNAKGDVNKLINEYSEDEEEAYWPQSQVRRDAGSVGGTAYFEIGGKEFKYTATEKVGPVNWDNMVLWTMRRIPEKQKEIFENSPKDFANVAKEHGCTDDAWYSVRWQQGFWSTEPHWLFDNDNFDGVCVKIESKGAKTGLKHSDYGIYTEDYILSQEALAKTPSYAENLEGNVCHFVNVYAGGKEVSESMKTANTTFKGSAVAQVQETDTYAKRLVYADNATLTVDAANNETIDMPFGNWYHVVIVRTENNITINFKDDANIPEYWKMKYAHIATLPVLYGNQKNGLYVSYTNDWGGFEDPFTGKTGVVFVDNDKYHENKGIHSVLSAKYYGDDPYTPTEATVLGYRNDRYKIVSGGNELNGVFFGFAFGGTRQR